ncbi:hypothetical protein [Coxiella burnetii]|uniref:hypothetical protein n=1 Tax=Coxiella burnetii TaxID=777 RepID=UPI00051F1944|nr:hypothetical protein [Coxiella burnetii]AIT63658.1 hypothetical protein CBNA_1414 [Coxiella burnetii str. Namibia]
MPFKLERWFEMQNSGEVTQIGYCWENRPSIGGLFNFSPKTKEGVEKLEIDMSVIKVEEPTEGSVEINGQYFRVKEKKLKNYRELIQYLEEVRTRWQFLRTEGLTCEKVRTVLEFLNAKKNGGKYSFKELYKKALSEFRDSLQAIGGRTYPGGSLGNCLIKIGCRINKTFKKTYENDKTLDHQLWSSLGESLAPLA